MQHTQGAMSHYDILKLPYVAFLKYLKIINDEERERTLKKRFRNSPMVEEYKQNINKWRKNQPPPWEVINGGKSDS